MELQARLQTDLERGFTGYGPHRDELALLRDGRELRVYGSQGEQRLALLGLLLAERALLAGERGHTPLMLLDDVMSELDAERRRLLAEELSVRRAERDRDDRPRPRARRERCLGHAASHLHRDDPAGGDGGMSRYAPRAISTALAELTSALAPATTLARVQEVWETAAGPAIAAACTACRPSAPAC